MNSPAVSGITYKEFYKKELDLAKKIFPGLLLAGPKRLKHVTITGPARASNLTNLAGIQTFHLAFSSWKLRLSRIDENVWVCEQVCSRCGGGGRWAPASDRLMADEYSILTCGGCGHVLAPAGTGIMNPISTEGSFTLSPDSQTLLMRDNVNPLEAVLEADSLDLLVSNLLTVASSLTYWQNKSRWKKLVNHLPPLTV